MGDFGQSAKGGPFAKISKLQRGDHFFGHTLKGYKIVNTSRVLI